MKIIISPAKNMIEKLDTLEISGLPVFLQEAETIKQWMQNLTYSQIKKLWGCSESIAEENFLRFQNMDLQKALTPALLSYSGIQYQYMSPSVFTDQQLHYVKKHLRILSGMYGLLEPFHGVTPYRLEMQAKAQIDGTKDLYHFWNDKIYHALMDDDKTVINLASKEYSKAVEPYLTEKDTFITCIFGELVQGKVQQKGTIAKMARGEMVGFLAKNNITKPEKMKDFDAMNFRFHKELSNKKEYVFLRTV